MPNMFTLITAGLVIPLNTACVEWGFCHHGIIKIKLTSRLKIVNVDSLSRVKLLCRDYKKFDYQRAMELHDSMHNSLISSLARKVDQLQLLLLMRSLPMRTLLISHLSQRVSLRRTLDLISVKLRMRKKQQQKMMSLVRQQSMANQQSQTWMKMMD